MIPLKKYVFAALLAAMTFVGAAFVASSATAEPSVNVGNNFCPAPWQWNGPFEGLTTGHSSEYTACTGRDGELTDASGFGNDMCLLPWQWNGPVNVALAGMSSSYAACD